MTLKHLEISNNPDVEDRLTELKAVQSRISSHLLQSEIAYKKAADRHFLDSSSEEPTFRVGDRIWLLRCNVKTTRPCGKLDYQRLDAFVSSIPHLIIGTL